METDGRGGSGWTWTGDRQCGRNGWKWLWTRADGMSEVGRAPTLPPAVSPTLSSALSPTVSPIVSPAVSSPLVFSHSVFRLVSHVSPRWFSSKMCPKCGQKIVSEFSSTISSCLPELVFQLAPSLLQCLPLVTQLFRSCLSDVVSRLSPTCLSLVFHNSQLSRRFGPSNYFPIISQLYSACFPLASQMLSSKCLPIVSLGLKFETVTAVGLHSWVYEGYGLVGMSEHG